MPPIAPQPVQISCPACGTPFRAGIYTLVDVGEQPELKQALLSGQLNVAVCPNCGTPSALGAPLIYHDPAKQLCLVHFPSEMDSTSTSAEQERFIGEATSFIMRSLPANAPRGYLLSPKRFLTLPSLLDAVLEADGVSREMLDAQRNRVELISQLAGVLEDDAAFNQLVEAHRPELTPEFFATLNAFIESTPRGQEDSRQLLEAVRAKLNAVIDDPDLLGEPDDAELAAAVEQLISADDEALAPLVAELRGYIDYSFFQIWTERIEQLEAAGQVAEAERLTARRGAVLDLVEELDREAQALFEAGSNVLQDILNSTDPLATLHANADKIDEAFLMVLSANIGAAHRAGQIELAEQMDALGNEAVEIIQSRMSPEERFINELLQQETQQESTKLLRKNVAKITPDLVKKLNEGADLEEKRGNKEASARLRQLARESGAMLF